MTVCADIIERSESQFGTSGVRGLVAALDDATCFAYTTAFLNYLLNHHGLTPETEIWFGHDLRPSSPQIATACMTAASRAGFSVRNCGEISTPALAFSALSAKCPAVMITGSHIPFDRNGIKFYRPDGEILKSDEKPIIESKAPFPNELFEENSLVENGAAFPIDPTALTHWINRYRSAFKNLLEGMRIGHYQHSAAGRDNLTELLQLLGAEVIQLGRSNGFIPIDTEAVSEQDTLRARAWVADNNLDALISTDGDGDRPLLADETGTFFRGDTLGILAAYALKADHVVTPVSSNSALEKSGLFQTTTRTKIGSPHVIAAMDDALNTDSKSVVGFEANGGFLTATDLVVPTSEEKLMPLPTRDAVLPILATIALAKNSHLKLSQLKQRLPARFTASDRVENTPPNVSALFIETLKNTPALMADLADGSGTTKHTDETDGLRMTFANDDVVHLRPSGNAPELRIYVESSTASAADTLLKNALSRLSSRLET